MWYINNCPVKLLKDLTTGKSCFVQYARLQFLEGSCQIDWHVLHFLMNSMNEYYFFILTCQEVGPNSVALFDGIWPFCIILTNRDSVGWLCFHFVWVCHRNMLPCGHLLLCKLTQKQFPVFCIYMSVCLSVDWLCQCYSVTTVQDAIKRLYICVADFEISCCSK